MHVEVEHHLVVGEMVPGLADDLIILMSFAGDQDHVSRFCLSDCGADGLSPVGDLPILHGGMITQRLGDALFHFVKDGQRIRLRGKGSPGDHGGPAGDLYVSVKVRPHRLFGRKDDNLTIDVPVSFDDY